jgi:hypothetical protein
MKNKLLLAKKTADSVLILLLAKNSDICIGVLPLIFKINAILSLDLTFRS